MEQVYDELIEQRALAKRYRTACAEQTAALRKAQEQIWTLKQQLKQYRKKVAPVKNNSEEEVMILKAQCDAYEVRNRSKTEEIEQLRALNKMYLAEILSLGTEKQQTRINPAI